MIVAMEYASIFEEEVHIYGKTIKKQTDFFERPFNSSKINIYSLKGMHNTICDFKLSDIKCKLFSLPSNQQIVVVPVIHTLDCNINKY